MLRLSKHWRPLSASSLYDGCWPTAEVGRRPKAVYETPGSGRLWSRVAPIADSGRACWWNIVSVALQMQNHQVRSFFVYVRHRTDFARTSVYLLSGRERSERNSPIANRYRGFCAPMGRFNRWLNSFPRFGSQSMARDLWDFHVNEKATI